MFRKFALAAFAAVVGMVAAKFTTEQRATSLDWFGPHDHPSSVAPAGQKYDRILWFRGNRE